jgi:putative ABC transport system permease protein
VRSRAVWLVLGIVGIAVGAAVATAGAYRHSSNIVLGGLVLGELGIVLCTPTIVGQIARLGRFLPLTPRIALRDASRRRAAAAPAISAVMAAVAGTIALTVYLGATELQHPEYLPAMPVGAFVISPPDAKAAPTDGTDSLAGVADAVHTVFPGLALIRFDAMSCGDYLCHVEAMLPPDRRCPWEGRLQDQNAPLSRAEMAQALADPRCAEDNTAMSYGSPQVVTDDPAVVAAFTGLTGTRLDEAVATLKAGGILVSEADYVENGRALLSGGAFAGKTSTGPPPDIAVPAYLVPLGAPRSGPILSPAFAASHHQVIVPGGVIGHPATMPTTAQQDKLNSALYRSTTQLYVERGDPYQPSAIALILAIAAGVVALGAAGIATGLAAADSRHDLTTLGAVGAAPRVRRLLSLSQSGIISGLGAVLGAVAGFGAAAAVLTGLNQQYAGVWPRPTPYLISVPWTNLLVSIVVVPLVAMAGAGLLTRSRLPSERRVAD